MNWVEPAFGMWQLIDEDTGRIVAKVAAGYRDYAAYLMDLDATVNVGTYVSVGHAQRAVEQALAKAFARGETK